MLAVLEDPNSTIHNRPSMSVTFQALLRIRGVECALRDGYAEAFYYRKLVCELKEIRES
jgi:hypothetical protein